MMVIISENNDYFTDQVIEWLLFYKVNDFLRINENSTIEIEEIDITEDRIVIVLDGKKKINLAEVDFFWYRRGNLQHPFINFMNSENDESDLARFFYNEWFVCKSYIFYYLQKKKTLGNFFKSVTNKLVNLKIAQACGFSIPETLITSERRVLEEFNKKCKVINKPIGEAMAVRYDNEIYSMLTREVDKNSFLNDTFFPSLYQQKIEKKYEIRVFVLFDEIYSMAIFSQNSNQTEVDYRNYDFNKMNRMVPYNLPKNMKNKIIKFMKKTGLDTGSIDLIKTTDNKYVFLEVNPAGNIEMLNSNCHYNLDRIIAEKIIKLRENEN